MRFKVVTPVLARPDFKSTTFETYKRAMVAKCNFAHRSRVSIQRIRYLASFVQVWKADDIDPHGTLTTFIWRIDSVDRIDEFLD